MNQEVTTDYQKSSREYSAGRKALSWISRNYVIVAFVLLFVFSSGASKVFATPKNLTTILLQNAGPGIIAMGMLYVIITGGIDLTVPSYVCLSVCLTAGFIQDGMGIWAIPLVMLIMVGFGFAIGFLVAYCKIAPFIVTLAFSSILKGLAYMYQVGQNRRIDGTFLPKFIQASTFGIPNPVWIMLGIFALAWMVLLKTTYGRSLFAIGGNAETARLAGINVKFNLMCTYALSGLLSSVGGIILCGRLAMGTSTVGDGYEMDAIAAVVVGGASLAGGVGSAWKTLIGVLLISVLGNIMNLTGIASYPQMVIKGVIIILAVLANMKNK